jgi:hypothetical protein
MLSPALGVDRLVSQIKNKAIIKMSDVILCSLVQIDIHEDALMMEAVSTSETYASLYGITRRCYFHSRRCESPEIPQKIIIGHCDPTWTNSSSFDAELIGLLKEKLGTPLAVLARYQ